MSKLVKPGITLSGARLSSFTRAINSGSESEFEQSLNEVLEIIALQLEKISQLPHIHNDTVAHLETTIENFRKAFDELIDKKTKIENDVRVIVQKIIDDEVTKFKNDCLIKISEETDLERIKKLFIMRMKVILMEYMEYSEKEDKIKKIITTDEGSLFLLYESGSLYVTGTNENGILGIGIDGPTEQLEFVKIEKDINNEDIGFIKDIKLENPTYQTGGTNLPTNLHKVVITNSNNVKYHSGFIDTVIIKDDILQSDTLNISKLIFANTNFKIGEMKKIKFDGYDVLIDRMNRYNQGQKNEIKKASRESKIFLSGINPIYINGAFDMHEFKMGEKFKYFTFCIYQNNRNLNEFFIDINGTRFKYLEAFTQEGQFIQSNGVNNLIITQVNRDWIQFFFEFETKDNCTILLQGIRDIYLDNIGYITDELEDVEKPLFTYDANIMNTMIVPKEDIRGDKIDSPIRTLDNMNSIQLFSDNPEKRTDWIKDKETEWKEIPAELSEHILLSGEDFKESINRHIIKHAYRNMSYLNYFYLIHDKNAQHNIVAHVSFKKKFKKMYFQRYAFYQIDRIVLFIDGTYYDNYVNIRRGIQWDDVWINLKEYKEHEVVILLYTFFKDTTNRASNVMNIKFFDGKDVQLPTYETLDVDKRNIVNLDLSYVNKYIGIKFYYIYKEEPNYKDKWFSNRIYSYTWDKTIPEVPGNKFVYVFLEHDEEIGEGGSYIYRSQYSNTTQIFLTAASLITEGWEQTRIGDVVHNSHGHIFKIPIYQPDLNNKYKLFTFHLYNFDTNVKIRNIIVSTLNLSVSDLNKLSFYKTANPKNNLYNGINISDISTNLVPDPNLINYDQLIFPDDNNAESKEVGAYALSHNASNYDIYPEYYLASNDIVYNGNALPLADIEVPDPNNPEDFTDMDYQAVLRYGEGNYKVFIFQNNFPNANEAFYILIKQKNACVRLFEKKPDETVIEDKNIILENSLNAFYITVPKGTILYIVLYIPHIKEKITNEVDKPYIKVSIRTNDAKYKKCTIARNVYSPTLIPSNYLYPIYFNNDIKYISRGVQKKIISINLDSVITIKKDTANIWSFYLYDRIDRDNRDVECEVYINGVFLQKCTYGFNVIIKTPGHNMSGRPIENNDKQNFFTIINTSYKPLVIEDIRFNDFTNYFKDVVHHATRFMFGHNFYIPGNNDKDFIAQDNFTRFSEKNNLLSVNHVNSSDGYIYKSRWFSYYIYKGTHHRNRIFDSTQIYKHSFMDIDKYGPDKRISTLFKGVGDVTFGVFRQFYTRDGGAKSIKISFMYEIKNTIHTNSNNGKRYKHHSKIFVYINGKLHDILGMSEKYNNENDKTSTFEIEYLIHSLYEENIGDITLFLVSYGSDTYVRLINNGNINITNGGTKIPYKQDLPFIIYQNKRDTKYEYFEDISNTPDMYIRPIEFISIHNKPNNPVKFCSRYYYKNPSGEAGIILFIDGTFITKPILKFKDNKPYKSSNDWTEIIYSDDGSVAHSALTADNNGYQTTFIIPYEEIIVNNDNTITKQMHRAFVDGKLDWGYDNMRDGHVSLANFWYFTDSNAPFKNIFNNTKIRNICFFMNKNHSKTNFKIIFKLHNNNEITLPVDYGYNTIHIKEGRFNGIDLGGRITDIKFNKLISLDNVFFNYDDQYKMELSRNCTSIQFDYYNTEASYDNFKFYIDGIEQILKLGSHRFYKKFNNTQTHNFVWTLDTDLTKIIRLSRNYAIVENILIDSDPNKQLSLIKHPNKLTFKNSLAFDFSIYSKTVNVLNNIYLSDRDQFNIIIDDEKLIPVTVGDIQYNKKLHLFYESLRIQKKDYSYYLIIKQIFNTYKLSKTIFNSDFYFKTFENRTFFITDKMITNIYINTYKYNLQFNEIGNEIKKSLFKLEGVCDCISFNIIIYDFNERIQPENSPRIIIDDDIFDYTSYITRTQTLGDTVKIYRINIPFESKQKHTIGFHVGGNLATKYMIYDMYWCDKRKIVSHEDIDIRRGYHRFKEDFNDGKMHTANITYGTKNQKYFLVPETQISISNIFTDYMKNEEITFTKKLYRFSFYAKFMNCEMEKLKVFVDDVEVKPTITHYTKGENEYQHDTIRTNDYALFEVDNIAFGEHTVKISYLRDVSLDATPNQKQQIYIDNILINNEPRLETLSFNANFGDIFLYYDFDLNSSFGDNEYHSQNVLKIDGDPIHYFRKNDFSRGISKFIRLKKKDHFVEFSFIKKFYRNTDKFDIYMINFFNPNSSRRETINKFTKIT